MSDRASLQSGIASGSNLVVPKKATIDKRRCQSVNSVICCGNRYTKKSDRSRQRSIQPESNTAWFISFPLQFPRSLLRMAATQLYLVMAISPQDISAAFADRPAFLIRAARPQDLHNLSNLLAQSFHKQDGFWGWTYPLLRLGIYEDLRTRIAAPAPHQVFLVAVPPIAQLERSNAAVPLAGGVEIAQRRSLWHSRPERSLYISNLAVAPNYRRQGVAKQMLAACERIAVRWNIPDLYLHVMEDNHAGRQLYHQAGFELLRADGGIASWFGSPRQLFLHKHLPRSLFL